MTIEKDIQKQNEQRNDESWRETVAKDSHEMIIQHLYHNTREIRFPTEIIEIGRSFKIGFNSE